MPTILLSELVTELEGLYVPPFGAVATFKKIRQVLQELGRSAGIDTVAEISPPAVARWFAANPARKPATSWTLLSSLRSACSYAIHRRYLEVSPFAFRKLPDWLPDYDPRGPSEDRAPRHRPMVDLTRVFAHLGQLAPLSWEGHRLYALAGATFLTGSRAREVQGALVADFDLDAGIFHVRPNEWRRLKTKRSRRKVVMPPELVPVLAAWLPQSGSRWAFPGSRRESPWSGGAPGRKPLDRLRAAGEACGVDRLTFLSFRHSYVTHSKLLWNVPAALTQQLCGHTHPDTTVAYLGFDLANARAAVAGISIGLEPVRAVPA